MPPLLLRALERLNDVESLPGSSGYAEAVAELSRLFTKERVALRSGYLDDPDHAAAYLRYFLPVNLSKIQVLLDEMPEATLIDKQGSGLNVLDLGSGPGTGALAVLDWLHQRHPEQAGKLTVVAIDSSADALSQAGQLWDSYCRESGIAGARLTPYETDLERPLNGPSGGQIYKNGPYDVIIMANCLNELFSRAVDPIGARTGLLAGLLTLLAPHGTMMLVEPALRTTSRELHEVRDRLLHDRRCTVYSPCLHERPCPALVNPDDWCHEERAWDPPAAIQAIDQEVGFIKDALKFSYLLLRTDGRMIVERRPDVYRVVSELRELKGEKRAWLCNELGRQEVGRQDRLASPENAAVDAWHRGAIVQIERIVRKEMGGKVSALGRIEQDATVKIVRPV
ncbi:MAG TPA: small ribosomal subunit Rsm22 family protein [Nitrospira sp.]|nr:small ribosomal subunit Rsm22 family protein [Nitrospira sp.]